jgi:hypothetical protein
VVFSSREPGPSGRVRHQWTDWDRSTDRAATRIERALKALGEPAEPGRLVSPDHLAELSRAIVHGIDHDGWERAATAVALARLRRGRTWRLDDSRVVSMVPVDQALDRCEVVRGLHRVQGWSTERVRRALIDSFDRPPHLRPGLT